MSLALFGLPVYDFYELAPVEFAYAVKFRNDKELDRYKTIWESSRYLAYHIWNSAGQTLKSSLHTTKDVGLFEWEVEGEKEKVLNKVQTIDEIKKEVLRIAKVSHAIKK